MKKICFFLLTLVVFLVYASSASAAQPSKVTSKSQENPAVQNVTVTATNTQTSQTPPYPMGGIPGTAMGSPVGQDTIPVIRESMDVIKELVKTIESSKLTGQNSALLNRAADIIKRGENAIASFTRTIDQKSTPPAQR